MEDKYNELLKNFMRDGAASVLSGQNTITNNLGKDINNYRNKLDEQNKYYNKTWGNQAFRLIANIDTWVQESGITLALKKLIN